MTSAILPARQIVKACEATIGRLSGLGEPQGPIAGKVALLIDLQKLAAAATEADGTVSISLDDFTLISANYKARDRG
ncbi:hypothetical protein [Acidisphaera sp. L21]|uniref:hypothetical protein n=1 Tax=Acidisphaera sp. L21 TaxID=1641851 RepID=UPI00131CA4A0|nr:hypothetical protein [Acidisphaera sp. L21]